MGVDKKKGRRRRRRSEEEEREKRRWERERRERESIDLGRRECSTSRASPLILAILGCCFLSLPSLPSSPPSAFLRWED